MNEDTVKKFIPFLIIVGGTLIVTFLILLSIIPPTTVLPIKSITTLTSPSNSSSTSPSTSPLSLHMIEGASLRFTEKNILIFEYQPTKDDFMVSVDAINRDTGLSIDSKTWQSSVTDWKTGGIVNEFRDSRYNLITLHYEIVVPEHFDVTINVVKLGHSPITETLHLNRGAL